MRFLVEVTGPNPDAGSELGSQASKRIPCKSFIAVLMDYALVATEIYYPQIRWW